MENLESTYEQVVWHLLEDEHMSMRAEAIRLIKE